jgi:hypothetical protein
MVFEKEHGGFLSVPGFSVRYKLIQIGGDRNENRYLGNSIDSVRCCAMDRQLAEWKVEIERIWSAAAPDYGEAVRIASHMASAGEETILRQAASQALPILRGASHEDADQTTRDAARRRLGVLREVLQTLITPQFGKRQTPVKLPTPEERYRQLLGLPLGCRTRTRAAMWRPF